MANLYASNYTGFSEQSLITGKFIWPIFPIVDVAPLPDSALFFFCNVDQPRFGQSRIPNILSNGKRNFQEPQEKKRQTRTSKLKDAAKSARSSDSGINAAGTISSLPAIVSVSCGDRHVATIRYVDEQFGAPLSYFIYVLSLIINFVTMFSV